MSDVFLFCAGGLGMAIAVVHGYLGTTKVVAPVEGIAESAKRVLYAIMVLSAVYWFIGGALLAATPVLFEDAARTALVYGVAALYGSGALGNAWATCGRHFGWILLAVAAGLAVAGA